MFIDRNIPNKVEGNRYEKFKHFWRLDDEEWLKQRKAEWELIKKYYISRDVSDAGFLRAHGRFFVFSEEKFNSFGTSYISVKERIMFTPYITLEETKEFIFSIPSGQRTISDNNFLNTMCFVCQGLPWLREKCQLFIQAAYGDRWQYIEEPYCSGVSKTYVTSPSPQAIVAGGRRGIIQLMKKRTTNYHFVIDCLDYFISCVTQLDGRGSGFRRKNIDFDNMYDAVDGALADPAGLSNLVISFAEELKLREQEIRDAWALHAHLDI